MSDGTTRPTAAAASEAGTGPDIDPDLLPASADAAAHGLGPVVAVVALGGAIGACGRYGASLLWPTPPGSFPWTTLLVNGVGCALIGVFMVVITEVWTAHRLVRPFFGTGVLGGFTTFSTYAVDVRGFLADGAPGTGLAYMALTLLVALVMVGSAVWATRRTLAAGPGRGRAR
ncbi:CrcB family protein [Streptomyces sp. NBC_00083]|uniref:fluoride efflux transporter FluC n=1 Tax=Streptomyces sp. NBC_00083 TaxID=2975647 RepID=UPI00225ADCA8|nr:CrcB family protein [Streptomyces sp. NBC_00083]MCX5384256.1 CrcB family protein [Streptomyces sp. NBC_00083]